MDDKINPSTGVIRTHFSNGNIREEYFVINNKKEGMRSDKVVA